MTTPLERGSRSRRLAAVWFADIVGFTRLAAENEPLALRLVEVLQTAATAAVGSHQGNVVKFTGDGVLAEFASARDGAWGAMQLLLRFGQLTEDWAQGPHQIRLGMHLGDVTVAADGDIYGDGVNRAARLEGLAEPGKLLISEDVYRQLRSRPDLILTDLGLRSVKGYDDPIRVYDGKPTRELAKTLLREAATPEAVAQVTRPRRSVRPIAVGLTVGILSFATLALWTALGTPSSDTLPSSPVTAQADPTPAIDTPPISPAADPTPTIDPGARDLLIRGREQLTLGTPRSLSTAAELFAQSITLAPEYAPAHLALAQAQIGLGKAGARQLGEVLPLARGHLEDAIHHDAVLAEAHAALASLLGTFEWDWEGAEREFKTALGLAPTPAIRRAFAELLSARGRHNEALAQVASALRDEPGTVANVKARGLALFRARSYGLARVALAEALRLDPADDFVRVHLARTQGILGERQQARTTLEGSDQANRSAYLQVWRAYFRPATRGAGQGRGNRPATRGAAQARGNQFARTLRETFDPSEARNPDAPYYMASLQVVLGDLAGAAESLQRAVRIPSPSLIWLATDPIWDPVRSEPEFERLVGRIDAGGRTP